MQVVMTHSVNVYQIQGDNWIQYLWCFIMTYSMPLFMIISGFWYKERSVSYSIKHYLFPCVLFSVINYVGGGIIRSLSGRNISKNRLGNVVLVEPVLI